MPARSQQTWFTLCICQVIMAASHEFKDVSEQQVKITLLFSFYFFGPSNTLSGQLLITFTVTTSPCFEVEIDSISR